MGWHTSGTSLGPLVDKMPVLSHPAIDMALIDGASHTEIPNRRDFTPIFRDFVGDPIAICSRVGSGWPRPFAKVSVGRGLAYGNESRYMTLTRKPSFRSLIVGPARALQRVFQQDDELGPSGQDLFEAVLVEDT